MYTWKIDKIFCNFGLRETKYIRDLGYDEHVKHEFKLIYVYIVEKMFEEKSCWKFLLKGSLYQMQTSYGRINAWICDTTKD